MNHVDIKIQNKIIEEFHTEFAKGYATATSIRRQLAAKYGKSISTIHKITTNGYKRRLDRNEAKLAPIPAQKRPSVLPRLSMDYPATYIFLGWEIRIGVNEKFLDIIDQIAKKHSATVFVTSLWPDDISFMPPRLQKYNLLMNDIRLNDNLLFKYVPTHALAMSPLTGWTGAFDDTVIMPGLIKQVSTEKTDKLCKQLMTTGSLGNLNAFLTHYRHVEDEETRVGLVKRWSMVTRRGGRPHEIARNSIVPSALIVEVKDRTTFFSRYVTMERSGVVYDLGTKYVAGKAPVSSRPSAMVLGDTHAWVINKAKHRASLEIIKELSPKSIVIQDAFDGLSVNHHDMGDYAKVLDCPTLQEEAEETKRILTEYASLVDKVYYLESNHDNFLVKFLAKEDQYRFKDNYQTAIALRNWQLETRRHPIIKLLELDSIKNLRFIAVFENLYISNVLVKHGHEGIAGRQCGFLPLSKIYNRYVQGHTHVPQVYRNAACVGTSSELQLNYTVGASAWLHSDVLIQPDGSLQHINIIHGQWRA